YPNPVRSNYAGTVFVRGLIDNSVVKIVDQSGNLVWETKSQGGQIEWPIKTLSGNRVSSGVYVVYAATTTGEQKAVSKILVIN
ncbi:MAG: T9SS type A sorting domain-containing protein, partial [Bacteroidota bacterium]|nr:T9SS type A sorting domain-containing protein [Bacteroidota bacterium]